MIRSGYLSGLPERPFSLQQIDQVLFAYSWRLRPDAELECNNDHASVIPSMAVQFLKISDDEELQPESHASCRPAGTALSEIS